MKQALNLFAAVAMVLLLAGCGGSKSPADIQKAIYAQIQKGNYAKAADVIINNLDNYNDEKAQTIRAFVDKSREGHEKKGGLTSFEITSEYISDDGSSAVVNTKLLFGNGSEETQTTKYVKRDGTWKISMDK